MPRLETVLGEKALALVSMLEALLHTVDADEMPKCNRVGCRIWSSTCREIPEVLKHSLFAIPASHR